MSKTVLVIGAMASAMVLACTIALLTAVPGVGKPRKVTLVGAGDIAGCDFKADRKTARLVGKVPGTVFTLGDNVYPEGTRAVSVWVVGFTTGSTSPWRVGTTPTLAGPVATRYRSKPLLHPSKTFLVSGARQLWCDVARSRR